MSAPRKTVTGSRFPTPKIQGRRTTSRLGGSLPASHFGDLAALDVEDEAGDHLDRPEVRLVDEDVDVLPQRGGVVVDREEPKVGTGAAPQLFVGDAGQTALGVLHDDDGVDPEHVR